MPAGGPYLPLLQEFQDLFPGLHPTPLIASVCFYTPIVRDLCSWCGVRQVSTALLCQSSLCIAADMHAPPHRGSRMQSRLHTGPGDMAVRRAGLVQSLSLGC